MKETTETITTGQLPNMLDGGGISGGVGSQPNGFSGTQASVNNVIRASKYDGTTLITGGNSYFMIYGSYKMA